jgi:hypothetical protein
MLRYLALHQVMKMFVYKCCSNQEETNCSQGAVMVLCCSNGLLLLYDALLQYGALLRCTSLDVKYVYNHAGGHEQ